jgi:REP element-mobilizing transposase RayT
MPQPRKSQVSLDDTPYYHCVSRCVRRAYLCGEDKQTGKSYEHRRQWVEDYLLKLADVFAIDVCAYAVMSNHTHIVLHVNQQQAEAWSIQEVLERWHRLHKGTLLTQMYLNIELRAQLDTSQLQCINDTAEIYRKRLYDLSWFMRQLNEHIAREANKEDKCTGRFWEGRFKSQALLDEAALMACMAYVDLNPVRAKMETTPESSKHTSVKLRAKAVQHKKAQPKTLFPFVGNPRNNMPQGLPFQLHHYLELVDSTGRIVREDKLGHLSLQASPIMQRLGIAPEQWLSLSCEFEQHFSGAVGKERLLRQYHQHLGHKRTTGLARCRCLLNSA